MCSLTCFINLFFLVAFSEGLADDGYRDVINIDISSVVVEAMQKKYSNRPQLKCILYRFQCSREMFSRVQILCILEVFVVLMFWLAIFNSFSRAKYIVGR